MARFPTRLCIWCAALTVLVQDAGKLSGSGKAVGLLYEMLQGFCFLQPVAVLGTSSNGPRGAQFFRWTWPACQKLLTVRLLPLAM